MNLSSIFCIVLIQVCISLAAEDFDELRVDNNIHQIVDSKNRIRIFHGINLVCKHAPWYYPQLLDEKYAKNLGEWGLNVVRLGTMWSGIEPKEVNFSRGRTRMSGSIPAEYLRGYSATIGGEYSTTYVNKLKTIITNFEKHGIWVILDMHQDVASKDFGTYDGFPAWLNDKFNETAQKEFPWPLQRVDNWFCGYLTYAACNTYQQLYDNYMMAADKMALAWKFIATNFKDHKNILGYDLLNEPWAGNIYKDGGLLSPAVAAKRNLVPLYEKVVSRIREVDSNTLIFWETVPYSHWAPNLKLPFLNNNIGNQLRNPAGLELFLSMTSSACGGLKIQLDANDKAFCRSLKDHETPRIDERDGIVDCIAKDSSPLDTDQIFGTGFQRVPGGDQGKAVLSWHYYFPGFVYQGQDFGMMIKLFARSIFAPQVFKTYWDTATVSILWDGQGNPINKNVKGLSRPYPLMVAGKEISYKFDTEKNTFKLKFKPTDDSGDTQIYIPEMTFGKNPVHTITPSLSSSLNTDQYGRIILTVKNSGGVREQVTVKIAKEGSNVLQEAENSILGQFQEFAA